MNNTTLKADHRVDVYDMPNMTAPNFNRPGGLMEVHHLGGGQLQVRQLMPNPASGNLPWICIHSAEMGADIFDAFVGRHIATAGGKLISK